MVGDSRHSQSEFSLQTLVLNLVVTLTVPLELFIPFMLIFVTNLTVGAASGYLDPHSTFRLYILFS